MKTKRILALFLAVVTCLSLAVSASAASISDFKDVDTKAWYAEAVSAAVDILDDDKLNAQAYERLAGQVADHAG